MPNENPTQQSYDRSHGVFPRLALGNCVCWAFPALGLSWTPLNCKVYFSRSCSMYLCNTTFSAFSSSPSDAEFDAIIGYLEDIIMGKLSKQTRWVLKMLHAHSQSTLCLLMEALSSLSFLLIIAAVKKCTGKPFVCCLYNSSLGMWHNLLVVRVFSEASPVLCEQRQSTALTLTKRCAACLLCWVWC